MDKMGWIGINPFNGGMAKPDKYWGTGFNSTPGKTVCKK